MTLQPNRRRVERVELPEPMEGMLDALPVQILDLGLMGAKIEHDQVLEEGAAARLRFFWRGDEINVLSRVAHSVSATGPHGQEIYQTGIEFTEASGDSGKLLRELIAIHVMRILEQQKANARGEREDDPNVPFLRDMSMNDDAGRRNPEIVSYVAHRLNDDGSWTVTEVETPKQPDNGFTVMSSLGEEELDLLKNSYASADKSNRHLIRAIAEMSITEDATALPPKRFA